MAIKKLLNSACEKDLVKKEATGDLGTKIL